MILIDGNLLLYARHARFEQHPAARCSLEDQLNGTTPVGLPWQSLTVFLTISINPRVFAKPLSIGDAWQQVQEWLACEPV